MELDKLDQVKSCIKKGTFCRAAIEALTLMPLRASNPSKLFTSPASSTVYYG